MASYEISADGEWACLTCNNRFWGRPKYIDYSDLTAMPMTVGQREQVMCDRCGTVRLCEFVTYSSARLYRPVNKVASVVEASSTHLSAQALPQVVQGTVVEGIPTQSDAGAKSAAPFPPQN